MGGERGGARCVTVFTVGVRELSVDVNTIPTCLGIWTVTPRPDRARKANRALLLFLERRVLDQYAVSCDLSFSGS